MLAGTKISDLADGEGLQKLTRQIEHLKCENSNIRMHLEESRLTCHTSKLLIDQLFKLECECQATVRALEERLSKVEADVGKQNDLIESLELQKNSSDEGKDMLVFEDQLALSQFY